MSIREVQRAVSGENLDFQGDLSVFGLVSRGVAKGWEAGKCVLDIRGASRRGREVLPGRPFGLWVCAAARRVESARFSDHVAGELEDALAGFRDDVEHAHARGVEDGVVDAFGTELADDAAASGVETVGIDGEAFPAEWLEAAVDVRRLADFRREELAERPAAEVEADHGMDHARADDGDDENADGGTAAPTTAGGSPGPAFSVAHARSSAARRG